MANGAKPLSRQLSHALESIQEQQQSNTKSLKFKKMVRALQDQTDTDQSALMPCLMAMMGGEDEMEMGDGGGDGNGDGDGNGGGDGDDDENDPFAFLGDYRDTACDAAGVCDYSIAKDDQQIKCDETGGKIIVQKDILFCKEDTEDDEEAPGMDLIVSNAPICFSQVCPDDTDVNELLKLVAMFMMAMMGGGDGTEMDMEVIAGAKDECASGTKLATSDNKDTETDGDKKDTETGGEADGGSSAAAGNIIWSFSVAAAVGIGAFLAV